MCFRPPTIDLGNTCPRCSEEIPEGATKCPGCGEPVMSAPGADGVGAPPVAPGAPTPPPAGGVSVPKPPSVPTPPK